MNKMKSRCVILVMSFIACCNTMAGQPGSSSMADIQQKWKERQDKASALRVELKCNDILHKGSTTLLVDPVAFAKGAELHPPRDFDVAGHESIIVRADNMKYSKQLPMWSPGKNKLYDLKHETCFDGKQNVIMDSPGSADADYSSAQIITDSKPASGNLFHLTPLFTHIRGLDEKYPTRLAAFNLTGKTVPIQGIQCVELEVSLGRNEKERLYLDQKRDYILIRKEILSQQGRPKWSTTVEYAKDETLGWFPTRWDFSLRAGKDLVIHQSGRRTVESYQISGTIASDDVAIRLPVGTRVFDRSNGKNEQYVVRPNGDEGKRFRSTANPTYESLNVEAAGSFTIWNVVVCAAFITFALVGVHFYFRRRATRAL
jgi:hypothetical protein